MFDDIDLERVRDGLDGARERVDERRDRVARSSRLRFVTAMTVATVFAAAITFLVVSNGLVSAVSVAQVGGFTADIGQIVGQDVMIYPIVGESSACRYTVNDREVPQSDERFLPMLQADIGQAEIPASANISLQKDIAVPNVIPGLDTVRIVFRRGAVSAAGLVYGDPEPRTEPRGGHQWIDAVAFAGKERFTGLDTGDSYEDETRVSFRVAQGRTYELSLTVGATAAFQHHGRAWIDWDRSGSYEADEAYDLGDCAGGGCELATNITVPASARERKTVMRVSLKRGSDPGPGEDFAAGEVEDYVVDVGPPQPDVDTGRYRDATGAYCYFEWVRMVQMNTLEYPSEADSCDQTSENYTDFTAANTVVIRGMDYTYNQTVRARANYSENYTVWFDWNRDGFVADGIAEMDASRYESVSVTYPTYEWITDVAIEDSSGTQIWSHSSGEDTGDGYQDFTDGGVSNPRLTPGSDYTISVTIDADSSYTERASVWFDWDQDRSFDFDESGEVGFSGERYDIASCTAPCTVSRTITIPDEGPNGNYASGPLMMRVGMNYSSNYPPCCGTSTYGEFEDYTVYIEEPGNEDLTTDEGVYVGQAEGNTSLTETVPVPADAESGGVLMRSNVRWAGQATAVPFDFRNNFDVYGQFEDYTVVVTEGENDVNSTLYSNPWTWYDYEWIDGVTVNPPVLDTEFLTEEDHEYLYYYGDSIAYADQTYNSTPVGQGGSYEIEVDVDDVGSTSYVDVWVDWDQDRNLEAGEQNRIATTSCGYCSVTGTINVPTSAPLGPTLMRVRLKQDGAAYGETEDYTLVVKENVDATQYSQPSGDTSFDEYIADVDFAGIANPTGNNGGYADFTNRSSVNLTPGGTYNAYMTLNTSGYEEHGKIWFDWDRDDSLSDESGYYLGNCSAAPTCVVSASITVPTDAVTGPTLMRAYQNYNSEPTDPTADPGFGEVEDYSVTVERTLPTGYAGSSGGNEWLERVQLNALDHSTGPDTEDGYDDNTYLDTGNLTKGQSYTLSATVGQTSGRRQYVRAWLDWDGDGRLEADEAVDVGACSTDGCTVSTSVTVPWTAISGSHPMRVIVNQSAYAAAPDRDVASAEIEDYRVDVAPYTDSRSYGFNDEYIQRFLVWGEGLDHSSGSSDYSDFTAYETDPLEREMSYWFRADLAMASGDTEYVRMWIDWDGDGSFRDQSGYDGSCSSDGCSVWNYITVPKDAAGGRTRLRVAVKDSGYPSYNETSFYGEVEDYTVRVRPAPVVLGDAAMRFSQLDASRVDLETTVIDEEYADGTSTDPIFGSSGSFRLGGQTVTITNATARTHFLGFQTLEMPEPRLFVEYNPSDPVTKDHNACLGFNVPVALYSDASGYSFGGDHITKVDFAYPLYRTSGDEGGYEDATEEYGTVTRGNSYTLTVGVDTAGGNEEHVHAWVDWDGDDSLSDESPIDLGQRSSDGDLSATVTVPAGAEEGPTLMRVMEKRDSDPTGPGETSFYGEVEDYTVVIE